MYSVRELLNRECELQAVSDTPRLDMELLLCHCLATSQDKLYAYPERELTAAQADRLQQLLTRRLAGEPIAYLCNKQGFWNLELHSDSRALIPRPDSELLVETALRLMPRTKIHVAELGVGSGAIALALAGERPDWRILATDLSHEALTLATQNLRSLHRCNVYLARADWYAGLRENFFDLILSNPPYVDQDDPALRQPPLCHEPRMALAAGLEALTLLAANAFRYLRPGGYLLLEHAPQQASQLQSLLHEQHYREVHTLRDLGGNLRLSCARTP